MTRSTRTWSLALAMLAGPGVALAAVAPEAAQQLAHKSGLWVQLDSLGSQVRGGMSDALDKDAGGVSAEQRARMLDCAQSAFDAGALRAVAVDAVAGALQPPEVPPLLAWYDGAPGRRIAAAEEASAGRMIEPQERIRQGTEALAAASAERRSELEAIVAETHSVEVMADTLIAMAFAVQQGMASLDPAA